MARGHTTGRTHQVVVPAAAACDVWQVTAQALSPQPYSVSWQGTVHGASLPQSMLPVIWSSCQLRATLWLCRAPIG